MLGYAALAGGVVVFLVPVYFFVWRCFKRQKQKDEAIHELQAIYR
jgi:preprotein translocase subunit YajC